eukprot:1446507-Pyramimonas_sp.AAC.1
MCAGALYVSARVCPRVVQCFATPCLAMPCRAMPCRVASCRCYAMLCYATLGAWTGAIAVLG